MRFCEGGHYARPSGPHRDGDWFNLEKGWRLVSWTRKKGAFMTGEGDVVLIHMDGKPAFFARIEKISPDPKPDWWQVKMLVLQVPLMVVTWILREAYINGEEFTMGGHPIRLVKVEAPPDVEEEGREATEEPSVTEPPEGPDDDTPGTPGGKVVSLFDRKPRKR
jgi:hypothetical protein